MPVCSPHFRAQSCGQALHLPAWDQDTSYFHLGRLHWGGEGAGGGPKAANPRVTGGRQGGQGLGEAAETSAGLRGSISLYFLPALPRPGQGWELEG